MAITTDQVKAFAAEWYRQLDVHSPTEEIARLVAQDDAQMIFPEKTLKGTGDFLAWYSGGTYSDGEKTAGVINIFFDENHNIASIESTISGDAVTVRVVVAWQASWFTPPSAKSTRLSADFTQEWTLRPSSRNHFGLEIVTYNAVAGPISYAPGFARL